MGRKESSSRQCLHFSIPNFFQSGRPSCASEALLLAALSAFAHDTSRIEDVHELACQFLRVKGYTVFEAQGGPGGFGHRVAIRARFTSF